jgi:hypothetical protein
VDDQRRSEKVHAHGRAAAKLPGFDGLALDLGFGIDASLTVRHGWDNATGYGTPNGLTFIDAIVAGSKLPNKK